MAGFKDRLVHAWNAFIFQEKHPEQLARPNDLGASYSYQPSRTRFRVSNDRSIIGSIYTRIGIDIAAVEIKHVRVDNTGRYTQDMNSNLNDCLTVEANVDQGASAFRQDIMMTLFETGTAAIVPVDTTQNPIDTGGYDVNSVRVGRVMQWYPHDVQVRLYNENKGIQQDIILPKSMVAIVENPLYNVMNEHNSTLQRLTRKLAILDTVDEHSANGQLDIIIQLPYVIKTEARREEAQKRLKEIEFQLSTSQHGIAYTDGTEKIVQLNRPAENNLLGQIQDLTARLYAQLGLSDEIMNGTANETTMINYYNRTIEPILRATAEAMKRTFLTKTARSQGQSIMYIRNPFSLVPVADLAELADKLTRNEILTSNEFRGILGYSPSSDPNANKLLNKNLPVAYQENPVNGVALSRPKLPSKSPVPQVPAIPSGTS